MVVEFARNILALKDAHSAEFDTEENIKSNNWVICEMPDASRIILGGTMRKGSKKTILK